MRDSLPRESRCGTYCLALRASPWVRRQAVVVAVAPLTSTGRDREGDEPAGGVVGGVGGGGVEGGGDRRVGRGRPAEQAGPRWSRSAGAVLAVAGAVVRAGGGVAGGAVVAVAGAVVAGGAGPTALGHVDAAVAEEASRPGGPRSVAVASSRSMAAWGDSPCRAAPRARPTRAAPPSRCRPGRRTALCWPGAQ